MRFLGGVVLGAMVLLACSPAPTPPATYRLSVAKAGDGSGVIASQRPDLINCGGVCSLRVERDVEVTLFARPDPGSTFEGWVDGCTGSAACTPPANSDIQVNAFFRQQWSSLGVELLGDGEGRIVSEPAGVDCTSNCRASFKQAERVTFRAIAAEGSSFYGWSGACSGLFYPTCDLIPEQARGPIQATFRRDPLPLPPFLSVVKSGAGSGVVRSNPSGIDCGTFCSHRWDAGTVIELTALPATGSRFERWTDGGTDPTLVITTGDVDTLVRATFSLTMHQLTVIKAGAGSGTIWGNGIQCGTDCTEDVPYGRSLSLIASADVGSWFTGWSEPPCERFQVCAVTLTQARSVTATFVPVVRVGNTTPFTMHDDLQADQITAERIVLSSSGVVHALGMIVDGTAWARMGLYADSGNVPGTLLAQTDLAQFGGVEQPLTSGPITLAAGTYWIAVNFESPTSIVAADLNGSSLLVTRSWPYVGPFPSPLAGTSTTTGASHNFYVLME